MTKKQTSRSYMCTCVAKINAFRAHGNLEAAREWAAKLQQHLKDEGLLT